MNPAIIARGFFVIRKTLEHLIAGVGSRVLAGSHLEKENIKIFTNGQNDTQKYNEKKREASQGGKRQVQRKEAEVHSAHR